MPDLIDRLIELKLPYEGATREEVVAYANNHRNAPLMEQLEREKTDFP